MSVTTHQRDLLGVYMDYLVEHAGKVHYSNARPNPCAGINTAAKLHTKVESAAGIYADCSGSTSLLFHLAGCLPPSGSRYGWSWGDTETIGAYLPRYHDPGQALKGGLIWFNYTLPLAHQHIVMVRHHDPDGDPVCFTHGGEADPHYRKLSYLRTGFENYVCLSITRL